MEKMTIYKEKCLCVINVITVILYVNTYNDCLIKSIAHSFT